MKQEISIPKQEIRHRRLHAFYTSKVLNSLMIMIIMGLLGIYNSVSLVLPGVWSMLALLGFIGYSLWLWIKKPKSIIISEWLSTVTGWYTLYFLVISAFKELNQWWYIIPIALAFPILFYAWFNSKDQKFEI